MPTKSITKPKFKSEAEEADWYHTKEGHEHSYRTLQKAIRKGKIIVEEKLTIREASKLAKETGKLVVMRNGSGVKPTDPAVLERLLEEARGGITKPVSLRIPQADLEAAKRFAEKTGKGYQTVLKEIIHEGLQRIL